MIDTDALALAWQAPDDGPGPNTDFGTTYQTTSRAPLLILVLPDNEPGPAIGFGAINDD